MPRKLRIEFAGAVYHMLDRGDRREAIFGSEADREMFLQTLGEACRRTGWRIHAYVLMSHHYHLLLETPEPNLVAGMKWFQGTYSIRFNCRRRLRGHVFQGRDKAVPVDPEQRSYLATLGDYIHLNPVRAGLVGPEERLVDYPWSSYPCYVRDVRVRPAWLTVDTVLGELDLEDGASGRRAYAEHLQRRAMEEREGSKERAAELKALRRGWCLGGNEFRWRVLALMDGGSKKQKRQEPVDASPRREHTEAEAERLVVESLAALGLKEEGLPRMRKNDERKILIGTLVRDRTMASNRWIAERLRMGDPSRASRYCAAATRRDDQSFRQKLRKLANMATSKV